MKGVHKKKELVKLLICLSIFSIILFACTAPIDPEGPDVYIEPINDQEVIKYIFEPAMTIDFLPPTTIAEEPHEVLSIGWEQTFYMGAFIDENGEPGYQIESGDVKDWGSNMGGFSLVQLPQNYYLWKPLEQFNLSNVRYIRFKIFSEDINATDLAFMIQNPNNVGDITLDNYISGSSDLSTGYKEVSIDLGQAPYASTNLASVNSPIAFYGRNTITQSGKKFYIKDVRFLDATQNPTPIIPAGGWTRNSVVVNPATAASNPTTPAGSYRVFYTDAASLSTGLQATTFSLYGQWWYGSILFSHQTIGGNNVGKYASSGTNGECMALMFDPVDLSGLNTLSIDVYLSPGINSIRFRPVDSADKIGPDYNFTGLATGQWHRLTLNLYEIGEFDLSIVNRIGFFVMDGVQGDAVLMDNIYAY
jgi:hypothetical protein